MRSPAKPAPRVHEHRDDDQNDKHTHSDDDCGDRADRQTQLGLWRRQSRGHEQRGRGRLREDVARVVLRRNVLQLAITAFTNTSRPPMIEYNRVYGCHVRFCIFFFITVRSSNCARAAGESAALIAPDRSPSTKLSSMRTYGRQPFCQMLSDENPHSNAASGLTLPSTLMMRFTTSGADPLRPC